jgi:mannose-1-phosphate guanylyltransferase
MLDAESAQHAQDEIFLNGTIVLPHKELKETVLDPGTIIM